MGLIGQWYNESDHTTCQLITLSGEPYKLANDGYRLWGGYWYTQITPCCLLEWKHTYWQNYSGFATDILQFLLARAATDPTYPAPLPLNQWEHEGFTFQFFVDPTREDEPGCTGLYAVAVKVPANLVNPPPLNCRMLVAFTYEEVGEELLYRLLGWEWRGLGEGKEGGEEEGEGPGDIPVTLGRG